MQSLPSSSPRTLCNEATSSLSENRSLCTALALWPLPGHRGKGRGVCRGVCLYYDLAANDDQVEKDKGVAEESLMVEQASQTDWTCEPDTQCLLATTAKQAGSLALWWEATAEKHPEVCPESPTMACEKSAGRQQLELTPDAPTCNAHRSACEKGNKAEKTTELQDEMQTTGLEPNGSNEKGNSGVQTPEQTPELLTDTQPLISACETSIADAIISACDSEAIELVAEMLKPYSACEKGDKAEKARNKKKRRQCRNAKLQDHEDLEAATREPLQQLEVVAASHTSADTLQRADESDPNHAPALEHRAAELGEPHAQSHFEVKDLELAADSQQPVVATGLETYVIPGLDPVVAEYYGPTCGAIISACKKDKAEKAIELFIDWTCFEAQQPIVSMIAALLSACDKDHKGDKVTYFALLSAYEKGQLGQHTETIAFLKAWGFSACQRATGRVH